MSDIYTDLWRRDTAMHEHGHAVIGVVQGHDFYCVMLSPCSAPTSGTAIPCCQIINMIDNMQQAVEGQFEQQRPYCNCKEAAQ